MKSVILKKAISVAAKEGVRDYSVKDVARESGCSEGLIFHYYDTKTNLTDSCYQYICAEFLKAIAEDGGCEELEPVVAIFCRFMHDNWEMAVFCLEYIQSMKGIEGLEPISNALKVHFRDKDESFFVSATRLIAINGCLYGSGTVEWDQSSEKEYKDLLDVLIKKF